MIEWPKYDSEDCRLAVAAAEAMAERFKQDVVILPDLRTLLLRDCDEPPIEIIRYSATKTTERSQ